MRHWKSSSILFKTMLIKNMGFPYSVQCKRHIFSPWVRKITLEKEMTAHSSLLAWEILWTEEPGRPQSMQSQRVGHNWACMHVSRKSRCLIISCTTYPGKLTFLLASPFTCEATGHTFSRRNPLMCLSMINCC